MHRSLRFAVAAGLLASAAGCDGGGNRPRVLEQADGPDPSLQLAEAVVAAVAKTPSASAYRELAVAIDGLRPFTDRDLERRAERNLVFLALPPLAAHAEAPLADQVDALALTVWPTALGVEPEDGESPTGYLERVCGAALARECKQTVPPYRPLVVSELVWRRLKGRAQAAYAACRECEDERSYQRALAAFKSHQTAASSARAGLGDRIHPRHWPRADEHARPWPDDVPLLAVQPDGRADFRGEAIGRGGWREAIREGRDGATVLGVHLRPTASVGLLRDVLRHAARAGYNDVALAAVAPEYPYTRQAYILAARDRRRGRRVRVRDVDTIQVLVQALGARFESADELARL